MLRRLLIVVALLLAVAVLGVSAQDATPEPTPVVIGEGGVPVAFWNGLTGSDGVTLNEMLTQFVAENPGISLVTEQIAWATLYAKLQAAFVAGEPPDVFILHESEVPQYAAYGVLKDLGPWYTSGGGWLPDDDIAESTMNGMMWDGIKYGIPLDNHGRGLWINTDMFEAAGLSTDPATMPTTYEGWVELLQTLTIDANGNNATSPDFDPENVVQWGYAVSEWPLVNFLGVLAQHGGSLVSEDGTTITVNSEAGITALQQTIDLVYTHHVSAPAAGFDSWAAWGAGTLAVVPTGTWFRNFAATTDQNGMAWPQMQWGAQPATWFGAHTWMVPASVEGETLTAVETLVRWVSENQVGWAASGQVPARLSAQAALDAENYPSNILLGATFAEYGIINYPHPSIQEMYAALEPELSEALNGLKTAEQALNDAAQRMQQVLDRGF